MENGERGEKGCLAFGPAAVAAAVVEAGNIGYIEG